MPAARRLVRTLLPLAAVGLAVALLAGPVLGQGTAGKKTGELADARCYGHHREEGFRYADLFPSTVTMVKKGEVFDFSLTFVVPWLQSTLTPFGFVNISGMPGAKFLGEKEPHLATEEGTLSPGALVGVPIPVGGAGPRGPSTASFKVPVESNATELVATLRGAAGGANRNSWGLTLLSPSGGSFAAMPAADPTSGGATFQEIRIPYANITQGGFGDWDATVTFVSGTDASAPFTLDLGVYYNLSRASEILVKGPDRMEKKEQHTFRFQIVAPPTAGTVELVYGVKGISHYLHQDLNADNYGNFTKWNTLEIAVGDQTVIGTEAAIVVAADPGPVMRVMGQVVGFASSFLLVPALVLGGTFGHASVRGMNKLLGGARRRVLWHNASSYLLLATAILHMYLFLIENFWDWTVGVIWGGLSLAALIGLGVTGGFQRRIVARWGFERWRFMHFSMGFIVVAFVLVHIFVDGSHLDALRIWLESL